METKQKSVWVLTYKPFGEDLQICGVYPSEDAATDALNDELFLEYLGGRTATDELVNSFYEDIKPEIYESTLYIKQNLNW